METMVDIRQLLKQYGSFIYTRDRELDLQLMRKEIKDLYHFGMITSDTYQAAMLLLRQEETKHRNGG
ncbi:YqgQ family protein [Shouchella sp. 1P09AA]|uniref:YqgQ family protein n=1 Tax=unclassified Shouchella TaxID=2893065 RepID=UPI00399F7D17